MKAPFFFRALQTAWQRHPLLEIGTFCGFSANLITYLCRGHIRVLTNVATAIQHQLWISQLWISQLWISWNADCAVR